MVLLPHDLLNVARCKRQCCLLAECQTDFWILDVFSQSVICTGSCACTKVWFRERCVKYLSIGDRVRYSDGEIAEVEGFDPEGACFSCLDSSGDSTYCITCMNMNMNMNEHQGTTCDNIHSHQCDCRAGRVKVSVQQGFPVIHEVRNVLVQLARGELLGWRPSLVGWMPLLLVARSY